MKYEALILYNSVFFILFIIGFVDYLKLSKNTKNLFLILAMIIMSLVAGFRGNTPDTQAYLNFFNNINYAIAAYKTQYLFIFYMELFKFFSLNFRWYIIITAFLSMILFTNFIKKMSYLPLNSYIVFYSYIYIIYMLAAIRNALAVAIVLNAFYYFAIKKRNFWLYGLIVILSSLIHISVLLFLPLYFINKLRLSRLKLLILVISTIFLGSLDLRPVIIFIVNKIYFIYPSILQYNHGTFSLPVVLTHGISLTNMFNIFFAFLMIIFWPKIKQYKYANEMSIFYIIYMFFSLENLNMSIIGRVDLLFEISLVLLFPILIDKVIDYKYLKPINVIITYSTFFFMLNFLTINLFLGYFIPLIH